jgi:hypothetical protein
MGLVNGVWSNGLVNAVSVAGLLSMVGSTWLMLMTATIYRRVKLAFPSVFVVKSKQAMVDEGAVWKHHIVLFGADRTGKSLLNYLKKITDDILVVDFNPSVVDEMKRSGVKAIFADATDPEIIELTNMSESKMIVSTIKDFNDSLFLLKMIKDSGIKAPMIVDAESVEQARELYDLGADYVIYPHFVSGHHLNQVVRKFLREKDSLMVYRQKQFDVLRGVYG